MGARYRVSVIVEQCQTVATKDWGTGRETRVTIRQYELGAFDIEQDADAFVEEVLKSELTREGYNHG